MSEQKTDSDAASRNGRPLRTHKRSCTDDDHYDHTVLYDATCCECGCCWGCDEDCCAEAFCPNAECGCSKSMRVPLTRSAGGESDD